MKLGNEEEVLGQDFRKKVIEEIEGSENVHRKQLARKRYDIFKDRTKDFVLKNFEQEMGVEVVEELINRVSNISFCRKIIEKKAMVYKDGVSRQTAESNQDKLDAMVDLMNLNSKMKKVNKYVELFKNCALQVFPHEDKSTGKWRIKIRVLAPYSYDVLEDKENPEEARGYILSYFNNLTSGPGTYAVNPGDEGLRGAPTRGGLGRRGDGVDQAIADSPEDEGIDSKEYIWWTSKYHFTTDSKGAVISGEGKGDNKNPIGILPIVSFAQDQDGHYWAIGGEDLIDSSVLINMLLTDLYYIAKFQGMGIFYITGTGVPKNMKIGPREVITLEHKEGEPVPQIGFATSDPPIGDHLEMIDNQLLYLLDTNNLSHGGVFGNNTAQDPTSGIHEIIRRAENMDDIEDQREMYRDNEPSVFQIAIKWMSLYADKKLLSTDWQGIAPLKFTGSRLKKLWRKVKEAVKGKELTKDESNDLELTIIFSPPQPFMGEMEKLNVIEKRRDLSLDTLEDSIKRDNPDFEKKAIKEKMDKIVREKRDKMNEYYGEVFDKKKKEEEEEAEEK